ncbi:hypothetical protein ACB092_08G001400 [Castanea dentata]
MDRVTATRLDSTVTTTNSVVLCRLQPTRPLTTRRAAFRGRSNVARTQKCTTRSGRVAMEGERGAVNEVYVKKIVAMNI